jgi:hypothetical protein
MSPPGTLEPLQFDQPVSRRVRFDAKWKINIDGRLYPVVDRDSRSPKVWELKSESSVGESGICTDPGSDPIPGHHGAGGPREMLGDSSWTRESKWFCFLDHQVVNVVGGGSGAVDDVGWVGVEQLVGLEFVLVDDGDFTVAIHDDIEIEVDQVNRVCLPAGNGVDVDVHQMAVLGSRHGVEVCGPPAIGRYQQDESMLVDSWSLSATSIRRAWFDQQPCAVGVTEDERRIEVPVERATPLGVPDMDTALSHLSATHEPTEAVGPAT